MILKHIALVCSNEQKCDFFYENLLGLKKVRSRILPPALSKEIFGMDREFKIIDYADDNLHFEIFVNHQKDSDDKKIEHVCLEIGSRDAFLEKCTLMGVEIVKIPRGEFQLVFVKDYDGNLFEIKEKN